MERNNLTAYIPLNFVIFEIDRTFPRKVVSNTGDNPFHRNCEMLDFDKMVLPDLRD